MGTLVISPVYAATASPLSGIARNSSNPFINLVPRTTDYRPAQPAAFTIPVYNTAESYLVSLINFILDFLGLIVIAMLVYGGFQYVLAMGDSGKLKKSKGIMTAAIVGFFIVVISFSIVATIITATRPGVNDCAGVQNGICINSSGRGVNFGIGSSIGRMIGSIF